MSFQKKNRSLFASKKTVPSLYKEQVILYLLREKNHHVESTINSSGFFVSKSTRNLSFSEQRIRCLAFIQNCFHAVISTNIGLFSMVKISTIPASFPSANSFSPKIFILGTKPLKFLPIEQKNDSKIMAGDPLVFQKNKTMPTCSRLSPRPSKYWIPCWTKMEVRSFHGSRLTRYIFVESGHKQPRWDTIQTCIFPDFFVVQIETPNITLKTKNSWPMGKKNGKTQRKIQRTMKPKGECRPSAIAKRTGPTCQPQPPIKPD